MIGRQKMRIFVKIQRRSNTHIRETRLRNENFSSSFRSPMTVSVAKFPGMDKTLVVLK